MRRFIGAVLAWLIGIQLSCLADVHGPSAARLMLSIYREVDRKYNVFFEMSRRGHFKED
jgi:hypothetical protein